MREAKLMDGMGSQFQDKPSLENTMKGIICRDRHGVSARHDDLRMSCRAEMISTVPNGSGLGASGAGLAP
jgi:homoserine kinase